MLISYLSPAQKLQSETSGAGKPKKQRGAWPTHFSFDEGIYEDGRSITFEASWMLVTELVNILDASGVWIPCGIEGGSNWKTSMRYISGWRSWLANQVNPDQDVIIDLGT